MKNNKIEFVLKNYNHYMSYEAESSFSMWGEECDLRIIIDHPVNKSDFVKNKLPQYTFMLKSHVKWIDDNKASFIETMVADGIVELADDWASSDSIERDGKVFYVLSEEEEIEAPVTKELFIDSLQADGVNLYIDIENDSFSFDMFFSTKPDFFAYHSIEVFLEADREGDYKININGLAG